MTSATDLPAFASLPEEKRTTEFVRRELRGRLRPIYGDSEAEAMTRLIFSALKGWSVTDMLVHADTRLSPFILSEIDNVLTRLKQHEPIQYILGKARFYGMDLTVTPAVLIPRPETEELVERIVHDYDGEKDLRVLDIGTGSGCIAISLARHLTFPDVYALDISEDALVVARTNARDLHAKVHFIQEDILKALPSADHLHAYHIIVSNPPYICRKEMEEMDANVLDHEPHTALFVPDEDPLLFYKAIADFAIKALKPGGRLYLEINPIYAVQLTAMLREVGFNEIEIMRDISRRERFAIATAHDGE